MRNDTNTKMKLIGFVTTGPLTAWQAARFARANPAYEDLVVVMWLWGVYCFAVGPGVWAIGTGDGAVEAEVGYSPRRRRRYASVGDALRGLRRWWKKLLTPGERARLLSRPTPWPRRTTTGTISEG